MTFRSDVWKCWWPKFGGQDNQAATNDPISAELWEIAENLHRCDLTKEQLDQRPTRVA